ncbi:putative deferrochelatase/peroxidase YfeX [Vanrija pseudolonga]|uniref:Deferrochelatase/peroxidase YfeX n=1 Tax=Vanrija pseudolonga TaxID=143232 RepID=A0AAF0Y8J1_9TREE|nr:putative deferrochelatase/peroxidase YfeX [Vanrija pseudolonga]
MSNPQVQAIDGPLTSTATFLILTVAPGAESTVASVLGSISGLSKNVAIRDAGAGLSVTVGIGARVWDAVTKLPRPAELHEFKELKGATHTAPSTPGDLLIHIRAERRDMVYEFERLLLDQLGAAVKVQDETTGFRYFDARDLLGFIDGTANPIGQALDASVLVAAGDDAGAGAAAVGGSYVTTQKYLHNLGAWNKLKTEDQEAAIGRTKIDNVELADQADDAQKPHKQLATIVDDQGVEHDILRDNMPFGAPGKGEYGTYFIGYSRKLWVTEEMLRRMFIGVPEGKHDRILDFSTPVTGSVFFVPSAEVLAKIGS